MSKNLSQQVVLDRRGFVAATFATVAGLGLAGCSDTSAEADKGSAAGSSKSSEDTEASTTLDAKAFDKLVDNGPKADDDAIAASTWATAVKDAGVFKIGGVQTSTLFSLLNEKDGQTRGFDAGIAQLLSNYILGENKVEITQVTSDTRESVLQNGQVDAVFATYTITDERKKLVSFAGPYYYASIVCVTKTDSPYANAAGISPELLHRVAAMASGCMDTLPHNGAVISLLAICKLTHRESYKFIFVNTVAFPMVALVVVITLGTMFGSF